MIVSTFHTITCKWRYSRGFSMTYSPVDIANGHHALSFLKLNGLFKLYTPNNIKILEEERQLIAFIESH